MAVDFKGQYSFPHKKFYYTFTFPYSALISSSSPNFPLSINTTATTPTHSTLFPSQGILRLCFRQFQKPRLNHPRKMKMNLSRRRR
jgi:hypothetical protein